MRANMHGDVPKNGFGFFTGEPAKAKRAGKIQLEDLPPFRIVRLAQRLQFLNRQRLPNLPRGFCLQPQQPNLLGEKNVRKHFKTVLFGLGQTEIPVDIQLIGPFAMGV